MDNGYLNWGNTVAPMKSTIFRNQARWSEWLESMRKDVECTFGILKGRFRILKAGVRLHGVNVADKVWMTCCAIHNWLLNIDGLNIEWQGEIGLFDDDEENSRMPFALRRLFNGAERRNYDTSGMGPGYVEDDDENNNDEDDDDHNINNTQLANEDLQNVATVINQTAVNDVKNLSCEIMRDKLIIHFDILFRKNSIQWPQR